MDNSDDGWVDESQAYLSDKMQQLERGSNECKSKIDTSVAYKTFKDSGIEYGPTFQGLIELRWDTQNGAAGIVAPNHWKAHTENSFCEPHLIHPTFLDALFQLGLPTLSSGGRKAFQTGVPTRLAHLWLLSHFMKAPEDRKIRAYASTTVQSFRTFRSSIIAAPVADSEPCLIAELELSTIANDVGERRGGATASRPNLFNMAWRPDLDALQGSPLPIEANSVQEQISSAEIKKEFCLLAITNALGNLPSKTELPSQAQPYLQRYVDWMEHQVSEHQSMKARIEQHHNRQELFEKIQTLDVEGQLLVRVATNLSRVLSGEVDPLGLLFSDEILSQFYRHVSVLLRKASTYIDSLAHKRPCMRVLEIGAGTGAGTGYVLDALSDRFEEYVYTDISSSFFGKAAEIFKHPRMTFQKLDISNDPMTQGFDASGFDLIVAANVLHATENVLASLSHCRKLLRDGGKMILLENSNPFAMRGTFIFGLLQGWWQSNDASRKYSPLLLHSEWDHTLRESQFSGIDTRIVRDDEIGEPISSDNIIITTALPKAPTLNERHDRIAIVYDETSSTQSKLSEFLKSQIRSEDVNEVHWNHALESDLSHTTCIFLPDLDNKVLEKMNEREFATLKHITAAVKTLIWVTAHDYEEATPVNPNEALVRGFARTVCSEKESLKFTTLTVQRPGLPEKAAQQILKLVELDPLHMEDEYEEREGLLHIPRVVRNTSLTSAVFDEKSESAIPNPWKDAHNPSLTISAVGLLDHLEYIETNRDTAILAPEEIEYEVKAVGLNFRDILVALGQVPDSYFGSECSGIVTRISSSPNLPHDFKVGDRFAGGVQHAMRKYGRGKYFQMHKIPDEMSYREAACYPVAFGTAYYSLVTVGRAREGDSVLIHSGAGGFGQAAIQLAKLYGCVIYTTVGSPAKAAFLHSTYGIPLSHIFRVERLTSKRA